MCFCPTHCGYITCNLRVSEDSLCWGKVDLQEPLPRAFKAPSLNDPPITQGAPSKRAPSLT